MRFLSALLAIAVVVLLPRGSEASPLIFTDRATFLNVHTALGLPPLAFETFDSNVWDINIGADVCRFSAGRDPAFSKPFPPDLSTRLSARQVPSG
jgi:hypothetical protein